MTARAPHASARLCSPRCSPWTGKCIGKYNLNWFYAFLATMLTLIVYVAACMFAWIVERATGAMPQ